MTHRRPRRPGMGGRLSRTLAVLLAVVALAAPTPASVAPARAAATLPAGFVDELVTGISRPTAFAFTPDGRLLITTQTASVRVHANGSLLAAPALDLLPRTCTDRDRGLLGIAVDPAFATNRYVYLYYTLKKHGVCEWNTAKSPVNRVSRFTFSPGTNTIDPASELVLIDGIPSPNGDHNAGDLAIGRDGLLYVTVGDGGCDYLDATKCAGQNDASRDQHVLLGKVLRVTLMGDIPPGNPFVGADSDRCSPTGRTSAGRKCRETFAWGLRNPFRFAFDPNSASTRFFINDVGQRAWEEIDAGTAGADYGWNAREGHCANGSTTDCGPPPAGMTNPIFDYGHGDGCASITGGAFVPAGVWPVAYDGLYLFGDYVCGRIFTLTRSGAGYARGDFATGLGSSSAVHMAFGPYGSTRALYYTSYANGGEVRRIRYTGSANRSPTAAATAAPSSGATPLQVAFDGSGSTDPDGNALAYDWDFGDGSAHATSARTTHTYTTAGIHTATLRVTDGRGGVGATSLAIHVGNNAPTASISSPSTTTRFAVGQQITLRGSATDAEDGSLPASSLSWTVILHHGSHTHPFLGPVAGNDIMFQAPAPEELGATENSHLEIRLRATDSRGLASETSQQLLPNRVPVTLASTPSGASVTVNGTSLRAPRTVTSWQGYQLSLTAPPQHDAAGRLLVLDRWSDGSTAPVRTVTTPSTAVTWTASYRSGIAAGALGYAADTFTRSARDGWGSAEAGGAWSIAGSATDFDVDGSAGTMLSPAGGSRSALLAGVSRRDLEVLLRVRTDRVATGSGQYAYAIVRRTADGSEYRAKLRIAPSGAVFLSGSRLVGGSESALGGEVQVPGVTHAANTWIRLRAVVSGANPTTLRLAAWADGAAPPAAHQWSGSDSTAALQVPGVVGLRAQSGGTTTNGPTLFSFDELWVSDVPYAADGFSRSAADRWGNAEIGGSWTLAGPATDYDVNGAAGTMVVGAGLGRVALLSAAQARDVDLVFRVRTDRAATGGGQYAYAVIRRMTDGSEYRARLRFAPTGGVYLQALKVSGGVESTLGAEVTVPDVVHGPGRVTWLRALVTGASPTSLKLRAWADGSAGPTTWQWTATDSTAGLQDAGAVGLRSYVSATATDAPVLFAFEDVRARRP